MVFGDLAAGGEPDDADHEAVETGVCSFGGSGLDARGWKDGRGAVVGGEGGCYDVDFGSGAVGLRSVAQGHCWRCISAILGRLELARVIPRFWLTVIFSLCGSSVISMPKVERR